MEYSWKPLLAAFVVAAVLQVESQLREKKKQVSDYRKKDNTDEETQC